SLTRYLGTVSHWYTGAGQHQGFRRKNYRAESTLITNVGVVPTLTSTTSVEENCMIKIDIPDLKTQKDIVR
ncbi:hypothetical protein ACSRAG_22970, partial [Salmonella enterica]